MAKRVHLLIHLRQVRKPQLQHYTSLGIVPYQPLVTGDANRTRASGGCSVERVRPKQE